MFYQQQAERPTVTATPAGDPPDLTALGLRPADAVMLLAAHVSRHGTLTEWLDASILDERDPSARDVGLDLYDPANPDQPPYTAEFLARYRAAQIARNRRITAWVKDRLSTLKAGGDEHGEFGFVVHGTMADPRWLDPTVDPNDRVPGWCYQGDPRVVNMSPVGPGAVHDAAQLVVPVELRRGQRRRAASCCRRHRARARDRQQCRRRLHAEPHAPPVRGSRPQPTRSSTRSRARRTTTPVRSSARSCENRSA